MHKQCVSLVMVVVGMVVMVAQVLMLTAYFLHAVPWFVWGFFKIINPFIDPLVRGPCKMPAWLVN